MYVCMSNIKALVCVIKVYMYKQFVRMYERNLSMYQQRSTTCEYICNMYICMKNLVMYVGVNTMFYICTCKHVLIYKQDGAICRYDQYICIYAYVRMYICMKMYVWTTYIYIFTFPMHLLKSPRVN